MALDLGRQSRGVHYESGRHDQRQLTTDAVNFGFLAWSPDGKKIAFTSAKEGNHEIYIMNSDGTHAKRLTNHTASDKVAVWSPDGKRLSFQSDRSGDAEIHVMQADGSNPVRLTHNEGPDRVFAWSALDGRIYFDSQRQGKWDIYVMNSDGTSQANLTDYSLSSWYPSLPAKRAFIVFGRDDEDGESAGLWIMDVDGENQRQLVAKN